MIVAVVRVRARKVLVINRAPRAGVAVGRTGPLIGQDSCMPLRVRDKQLIRGSQPSGRPGRLPWSRPLTRAALAVAAAISLTAAACSSAGAAPRSSPPAGASQSAAAATSVPPVHPAPLSWHSCPAQGARAQCASLRVPLDYRHPGGRMIALALSRVPATAPPSQQQGVLLVNPGGPGGSGLGLAGTVATQLDPRVAARYTIVGFDPRGVGSSTPALHCEPGFFRGVRPDYIPASLAAERVLENRAKTYAADCQKRFGWLLPYMTTVDVARDVNTIRAALGQQKINYFAYSYGTYIGEVYATLFSQRVRRMVLDSTVGPAGVWYADNIGQDYAFQGRMNAFFGWVARYNGVYHLGSAASAVRQAWYRVRTRLTKHPISGPSGPLIGPDEYDDTFLQGGYANGLWPGLAAALGAYYRTGSAQQVLSEYNQFGTQNENQFAVYNAVQCSDVNWPRSWAKWNSDTRRVYRTAPFEAWDNAWFNAACAFWPVKGPARPLQIKGSGLTGILMLQGSLDAATPYTGAMQAHRLLPSSRIVVVEGGGNHGQSLSYPPNTCVNGYLNRYLATGALPQAGGAGAVNATCPALPPPPA
jgi:pimeloyl-ACP methyl ester carboxylesterase